MEEYYFETNCSLLSKARYSLGTAFDLDSQELDIMIRPVNFAFPGIAEHLKKPVCKVVVEEFKSSTKQANKCMEEFAAKAGIEIPK